MRSAWLVVGVGGALGSVTRHGASVLVTRLAGHPTHYATLVVNVVGCAVIGLLAGLVATERLAMAPTMRLFVFVGVLGGFTTFSTFGLDTYTLVREGRQAAALWNIALQVVVGLSAVAGGYLVGAKA
jgi:CrcB protein